VEKDEVTSRLRELSQAFGHIISFWLCNLCRIEYCRIVERVSYLYFIVTQSFCDLQIYSSLVYRNFRFRNRILVSFAYFHSFQEGIGVIDATNVNLDGSLCDSCSDFLLHTNVVTN
jgi:hypothetical protein